MSSVKRFVILISGRGSNMQKIVTHCQGLPEVNIAAVIAHTPMSAGLEWAQEQGINTAQVLHKDFARREDFEQELLACVAKFEPDYVILAGFMRILTNKFIQQYPNRIINIHPSLLPSFPGLNTHQQALDEGVCVHGCTVHVVTPELDHGPIIAQAAVAVDLNDNATTLAQKVLVQEHQIYPAVVATLGKHEMQINGHVVSFSEPVQRLFGI